MPGVDHASDGIRAQGVGSAHRLEGPVPVDLEVGAQGLAQVGVVPSGHDGLDPQLAPEPVLLARVGLEDRDGRTEALLGAQLWMVKKLTQKIWSTSPSWRRP